MKSLCRECGARFEGRPDRVYCTAKCRRKAWSRGNPQVIRQDLERYAGAYKRVCQDDRICSYCGDEASLLDHFVPVSIAGRLVLLGIEFGGKVVVPCCSDCKVMMGSFPFPTVAAKSFFIRHKWLDMAPGVLLTAAERKAWRVESHPEFSRLAGIRFEWCQFSLDDLKTMLEQAYASEGRGA